MSIINADAKFLYEMIANGYRNLLLYEEQVNNLNVFPVPDGDTGTNMVKTLAGGISLNPDDYDSVSSFMKQFSKSVLLSARGNSGVILSQYIRGWANAVADKDTLAAEDLPQMLLKGSESAYGAVPTPVEGTILTVIREPAEQLSKKTILGSFEAVFEYVLEQMKISLQRTPELLPVLKEAGVVDSGGMGIIYFIEGIWAYLNGEINEADSGRESSIVLTSPHIFGPDSILEYGYCTEFVLQLMNAKTNIPAFSINNFITYMETIGDSIVAVLDDDIVKVHVHTFTPEKALAFARNYGEFITVKIENMSIQHNETTKSESNTGQKLKFAVVAVASGDGIKNYFSEIGANRIIEGGQTQNPSAQDFIDAFKSLNAEHIVVLPNNSNIYATAKQAAEIYSECDIRVLATKSVAEGYSALSMMNTWAEDIDSFISDMTDAVENVTSGSITKAVRDAKLNSIEIQEGMYMGIADGNVVCTNIDKNEAAINMLKNLSDIDNKSVITIFYGDEVSDNEAENLANTITSIFSGIECGIISGRQKTYDYYIAIE